MPQIAAAPQPREVVPKKKANDLCVWSAAMAQTTPASHEKMVMTIRSSNVVSLPFLTFDSCRFVERVHKFRHKPVAGLGAARPGWRWRVNENVCALVVAARS